MKKRLSIIIALSGLFILNSGCDKKTDTLPENRITTIEATTAQPETKTTLGDADEYGSRPVLWNNGDEIMVVSDAYSSTTMTKYKTTLSTPSSSASFSATGAPELKNQVRAFYPAKASVSFGRGLLNVTLPTYQKYVAGGFDNSYNPAAAHVVSWTSTSTLSFKNCFSVMKLKITGTGKVLKITVRSKTLQLSGGFSVTQDNDVLQWGNLFVKKVVLDCGVGVDLTSSGTNFHIVVPGRTYTNDLVIHIETKDNGFMLSESSKTITLVKGNIHEIRMNYTPDTGSGYVEEGVNYGAGTSVQILIGGSLVTRTFAPVNCGFEAESTPYLGYTYGKLYQWGRKFGQGYNANDATFPSGSNIVFGPVSNATGQDAANYNMFYKVVTNPTDWCTTQSDNLWNSGTEAAPIKTIYDPCPAGWRVPTYTEYQALCKNKSNFDNFGGQNGYWYSGNVPYTPGMAGAVFFPAAGILNNACTSMDRGVNLNYWSSYTDSENGMLWNDTSIGRANACSIRCVKI